MYKYYNEDFQYAFPFSPNGVGIHADYYFDPTYEIELGQQIDIIYNVQDGFMGYPINVVLYNDRYELVYDIHTVTGTYLFADNNSQIKYTISAEESAKYFKAGIYYIGFYVTKHPAIVVPESVIILSSLNQCILRVI